MRTWLLTPDGVWAEVTDRLAGCDPDPARWPWSSILLAAGGGSCAVISTTHLTRADVLSVREVCEDRWVANVITGTICVERVDLVTVMHMAPISDAEWLDTVAAWAGRPYPDTPPAAWESRRARWLIWAHSNSATAPALDGARVVPGAMHPA